MGTIRRRTGTMLSSTTSANSLSLATANFISLACALEQLQETKVIMHCIVVTSYVAAGLAGAGLVEPRRHAAPAADAGPSAPG